MSCHSEYKCLIKLASLYRHNVLINGEKWNKFENTIDDPMSEKEVIAEIKNLNCDPDQLLIFDYSKGWPNKCP